MLPLKIPKAHKTCYLRPHRRTSALLLLQTEGNIINARASREREREACYNFNNSPRRQLSIHVYIHTIQLYLCLFGGPLSLSLALALLHHHPHPLGALTRNSTRRNLAPKPEMEYPDVISGSNAALLRSYIVYVQLYSLATLAKPKDDRSTLLCPIHIYVYLLYTRQLR